MTLPARRGGFSLIEVLLVIAILVIMAALSVPMMDRLYGDMKLDAASDQIRGTWAQARANAMREGRPYRFAIRQGTGAFRTAPARVEFWPESDLPSAVGEVDPAGRPAFQLEEALPAGILFEIASEVASEGGWIPMATFMPDGTCLEDVTLSVGSPGYPPVVLQLRGLTGSVTSQRGRIGGG